MNTQDYFKQYDRIFIDFTAFESQYFSALHKLLLKTPISDYGGEKHVIVTEDTIKLIGNNQSHLNALKALQNANIGYYRSFPVSDYEIIFERFTQKYSLLLITQDQNLAHAVLQYPYPGNHLEIGVVSVGKNGELYPYKLPSDAEKSSSDFMVSPTPFSSEYLDNPIQFQGIDKYDVPLNHTTPKVKDKIKTLTHGEFTLTSLLTDRGGEGDVFNTNQKDIIVKIYKKGSLTKLKEDKLRLMISNPLIHKHIAYPLDIVMNYKNEFVGYIMKRGKGVEIGEFFAGRISANKFKKWDRLDLVDLAISVLKVIKVYHSHNLLIGDINAGNFLVHTPTEVTLVDVDSAQVEKFPCPVGRPEFTPPELLGNKSYREFFRSFDNEYYSIAVLLFRIITLGINHTAKIGKVDKKGNVHSEKLIDKICSQSFGFYNDEKKTSSSQNPRFSAIWSHLPSYIKEGFINVFDKSGSRSKMDNRLSVDEWLLLFESYKVHLEDGILKKKDSQANVLYFKDQVSYKSVVLIPNLRKEFTVNAITIEEAVARIEHDILNQTTIPFPAKDILSKLQKKGIYKSRKLKIRITKNIGVLRQVSCQFEI